MDAAMPRRDHVPSVAMDHLEAPSPLNPLGVKGVGESGSLPVAAVVASAVENALSGSGIRVDAMPLTAGALRRLLRRERPFPSFARPRSPRRDRAERRPPAAKAPPRGACP